MAQPGRHAQGWTYADNPDYPDCIPDHVNGFSHLHEAYTASAPDYTGKVTVPTLWDKKTNRVVNNESSEIIRMFNSAFEAFTNATEDYYPADLRAEIDEINEVVYHTVNNGVYRTGFAATQEAYNEAVTTLFATLDDLEDQLSKQRYLVGDRLTEADWRLWVTLIRFDACYVGPSNAISAASRTIPTCSTIRASSTRFRESQRPSASIMPSRTITGLNGSTPTA